MWRLTAAALLCLSLAFGQDSGTLNEEGKAALAKGDLVAALAKFRDAARSDPANPRIQFNIGLVCIRQGKPSEAIQPFKIASGDASLAEESRYLLGAAYFETGDFASVAPQLAGLETSAHGEHVLFLLEESYRLTRHAPEARRAFHELNTRFPNSPWIHYLLGNAYENQAEHEKAIAEYQAALASHPTLPNASFAIGYIYWQDRSFDEAKPWLKKELVTQPCHTLACFYLGEIARTEGDSAGAVRFFRRAIECDDRNAKAHFGLGLVLSDLHRDAEAVQELRRAAQLNPEDATSHYRLALLYRKLGQRAAEAEELDRVKKIHAAGQAQAVQGIQAKP